MKVAALVSGGKDSCYSMMQCIKYNHQIVAIINLHPIQRKTDELDSFMFQTVGHHAIDAYAACMGLPLYRNAIEGEAVNQSLAYDKTDDDEVESLFYVLKQVKEKHPEIQAICSGAILSNYQRNRVENVCSRLGLVSLAYLWERDQKELLKEMIDNNIEAILIKVAAYGLSPKHLGKSIRELYPELLKLNEEYALNVCGEGGEYETFTLDCPLFKKKIVIDEYNVVKVSDNPFAPVAHLHFLQYHTEDKQISSTQLSSSDSSPIVGSTSNCKSATTLDVVPRMYQVKGIPHVKSRNSFMYIGGLTAQDQQVESPQQLQEIMNTTRGLLQQHCMNISDVFFVYLYLKNMSDFGSINTTYNQFFGLNPPSRACVQLPLEGCAVMVEMLVQNRSQLPSQDARRSCLHVQSISCWAPACIGPYSQAHTVGNIVYLAGQIGLDPPTMNIISTDVRTQAALTIKNIQRVLAAVHSSLEETLLCTVYLTNKQDFEVVQEEWSKAYQGEKALLQHIEVPALPKGAVVELQLCSLVQGAQITITSHDFDDPLDNNFKLNSHLLVGERSFCLLRASIVALELCTDASTIAEMIKEALKKLQKHVARCGCKWDSVLYLRLYFDVHKLEHSILTSALELLGEDVPLALACIPTTHIPNAFMAMELASLYNIS